MNTKIDDLCDEIASEICTHIIDQYRALNGENDTWNELISFLQPEEISLLLKQKILSVV
ncbi:hypothetical protein U1T65_005495 [Citrobacter freundii]|nr:hypothetical protein [Citrobacter freundii]